MRTVDVVVVQVKYKYFKSKSQNLSQQTVFGRICISLNLNVCENYIDRADFVVANFSNSDKLFDHQFLLLLLPRNLHASAA